MRNRPKVRGGKKTECGNKPKPNTTYAFERGLTLDKKGKRTLTPQNLNLRSPHPVVWKKGKKKRGDQEAYGNTRRLKSTVQKKRNSTRLFGQRVGKAPPRSEGDGLRVPETAGGRA